MRKRMILAIGVAALVAGPGAGAALAGPPDRAQNPFVCPVLPIPQQAFDSAGASPIFQLPGGDYSIQPGKAFTDFNGNVPNHATNQDGAGTPPGDHAGPGDDGYSAIWSGNPG